jgi:CBS domain-containing protein
MSVPAADRQPTQHVYRAQGSWAERPLRCAAPDPDLERVPTIADLVPVTQIMAREVTCAHRDLAAPAVVDLIVRNRIGCIPVVDELGRPIGMITKLDLVEQMIAIERDPAEIEAAAYWRPTTANDLMIPLAITLGERATIAHAAALMASDDVHHIPIIDDSARIIGIVSTMDVVRWLAKNDGFGQGRDH